ncbi:hypothetical protein [Streptomyces sp. 1222.5]|uniref:hypothetical protein n=1 Tax=Streptomyces sp. 1222.5 TaxID=1881026 RepID=UPI003D7492C2
MTEPTFPRPFVAQRDEDVSGVSGEGVIAEGVQFSDGWVVTHWLDQPPMHEPKTDVWHNKGSRPFERIHGHGGATRILWADEVAAARRNLAADVVEAFDVPGWVAGPDTECEILRRRITKVLSEASFGLRQESNWRGTPGAIEVTGTLEAFADAVLPIIVQLQEQRDRARRAVAGARTLAAHWQSAYGSAAFLVRVAGVDLGEALDGDETAKGEDSNHLAELEALRKELERANAVTAEVKRLMGRRTGTLRRRAKRAEARRDRWRERAKEARAANERVRTLATGQYYGITGRAFLAALDGSTGWEG